MDQKQVKISFADLLESSGGAASGVALSGISGSARALVLARFYEARREPLLVVLPDTIEQVRRVLAICRERQVPVVARGAGTGLSGGGRTAPVY